MIAATGLRCVLTVLCALPAAYGLWRAAGPRRADGREAGLPTPAGRVTHLLHALMAVAMGLMAWPEGMALPAWPQTVFFSLAAVWFPAAALLRQSPDGGGGRTAAALHALPHAAAMAAMAWMVHAMGSDTAGAGGRGGMAGMPGMDMSGTAGAATMTLEGTGPRVTAAVLAGFFLLCALHWIARAFDTARARTPLRGSPVEARDRPAYGEDEPHGGAGLQARGDRRGQEYDLACHGAMALGMAVMLLVMV